MTNKSGKSISSLLKERVLLLDGAMGTMIQRYKLTEEDYRGERFKNHPCDLKGNNDLLSLTRLNYRHSYIIDNLNNEVGWSK